MSKVRGNKDLINIKIYITKRINNEEFWLDSSLKLISPTEVNKIDRNALFLKYWNEYLQIKFPEFAYDEDFKNDFLIMIDKAIVKIYFVKYNIIILNNTVSQEILRQSFKGPDFYPYMKDVFYMVDASVSEEKPFLNKATDKQLSLLTRLLSKNTFLKFDFNKRSELTLDECSVILNYLTGKSNSIESDIVKKYFRNLYNDSVFNFFDNLSIRESFKKSIFSFLIEYDGFFINGDLIDQESCNELNRIDIASTYIDSGNELIEEFINSKNRKNLMMDSALFIDRSIPKVYYILYCATYTNELIEEDSLHEFDHLQYPFTKNLEYKLSSYMSSNNEYNTKATVSQIGYIYKLLEMKSLPLILKDHRNLSKKDASIIINMLKANNLDMEYKESFFDEKI